MPLLRPHCSEAISPTALYTGFAGACSGLSPPGLVLATFVRGSVHLHFGEEPEVVGALKGAGFASAEIHRAHELSANGTDSAANGTAATDPAAQLAHIIEARTA